MRIIAPAVAVLLLTAGCANGSGNSQRAATAPATTVAASPAAPSTTASVTLSATRPPSATPSSTVAASSPPSAGPSATAEPSASSVASASTVASTSSVPPDTGTPSSTRPSDTAPGAELTVSAPSDLTAWNAWPNGNEPPLPHTTCGATSAHFDGVAFKPAPMRCFAKDVATCHAGSIAFTLFGVDSGEEMVATVHPGSPCRATVVASNYTANGGGYTSPPVTLQCTAVKRATAVRLTCQHQVADWPVK